MSVELERCVELVRGARRIAVLTGAGMSRESGLPTFREAQDGLWSHFEPQELATESAFRRDPSRVFGWYLHRLAQIRAARPHAGYHAVARLARACDRIHVVTQNVDGMHQRAGSDPVIELHGRIDAFRCLDGAHAWDGTLPDDLDVPADGRVDPPRCSSCGSLIRPGVVWFGEPLPAGALEAARDAVETSDLLFVIGTSAVVFPAAELPQRARDAGCPVVEINPEPTPFSARASLRWRARAGVALPQLVDRLQGATAMP